MSYSETRDGGDWLESRGFKRARGIPRIWHRGEIVVMRRGNNSLWEAWNKDPDGVTGYGRTAESAMTMLSKFIRSDVAAKIEESDTVLSEIAEILRNVTQPEANP